MAQTIKLRRSATQGGTPTVSQLSLGEVAINTYDGKMYIKKDSGTASIVEVGGDKLPLTGGTLTGNLSLGDNVRARFGTGNDLQIYHNNDSSYIRDLGEGSLYIDTNGPKISLISDGSYANGKMADFVKDGAVTLYHDNSTKLATTSTGINVAGDVVASGRIKTTDGLFQADEGSQHLRQYAVSSGSGTQSFLLGKIKSSNSADGGVTGIVKAAYDYGDQVTNVNIHFTFSQRSGLQRGHWWYENTDDDTSTDVVSVKVVNDGTSNNYYVWLHVGDYVNCFVETTWRQVSSSNITDSGSLTAGTITTGTTLFDTANDPTSEHHIGKLYAHDEVSSGTVAKFYTASDKAYFVAGTNDGNNQHLYLGSYHGSTLKQLTFSGSNNGFYPQTNAAIDLGLSTHKFKDLFLSGTANVGGLTVNSAFTLPTADGSANQVLKTDGSGNVSWAAASGSGTSIADADNNTKIQVEESADENKIRFDTAGSERMIIDANGKVGIGTASPVKPLHVNGGTTDYVARFESSDNNAGIELKDATSTAAIRTQNGHMVYIADTGNAVSSSSHRWNIDNLSTGEKMRLNAAGQLGIGTTAPSNKLHVTSGTVNTAIARFTGANNDRGLVISTAVSGITNDSIINYDAVSTNSVGQHAFKTDGTERVRINASGNVGIGTTAPNAQLEINSDGSASGGAEIRLQHANNNTNDVVSTVNFANNAGSVAMIQSGTTGANNTGYISFFTDNAGTSAEKMRILGDGNVGIGTTTPAVPLHVNGFARLGGLQLSATTANIVNIANGDLKLGTNNTEKMRITAAGKVGIGTSNPQDALDIDWDAEGVATDYSGIRVRAYRPHINLIDRSGYTTTNGKNFQIKADTAKLSFNATSADNEVFDVTRMVIDGSGNVGIGTTAPDAKLRIDQDAAATGLKVTGGSGGVNIAEFNRDVGGTTSVTISGESARPQMKFSSTSNSFALGVNSNTFEIADNSVLGTNTRFSITNAGNVGIGTTAPSKLLTVHYAAPAYNTVDDVLRLVSKFTSTNNAASALVGSGPAIVFAGGIGDNQTRDRARIVGVYEGSNQSGLSFHTQDTADIITEKMRLTSAANGSRLGIGTNAPTEKLHIHGGGIYTTPVTYAGNQDHWALKIGASNHAGWDFAGIKLRVNSVGGPRMSLMGTGQVEAVSIVGGNVGIGTIAPAKTLDVAANGASQGIHLNISGVGRLQMYADGNRNYFKGLSGNGHRFTTTGGANVEILNNGNVGIGTTAPAAQLQVKQLGINVNQSSVASTNQYTCDSMSASIFRSARYTIQITNTTDSTYHLTEMLLIHDGTTPSINEFGTIFTGSAAEAVFTADINSGNVRLLATPASSDAMQFKVVRHSILV